MKFKFRKLRLTLATIALTGALFCTWLVIRRASVRIDRSTAELIRLGMTRTQVEEIIGGPPGNYAIGIWPKRGTWEERYRYPTPPNLPPPFSLALPGYSVFHPPKHDRWLADRGQIWVQFNDVSQTVEEVWFLPDPEASPWYSLYTRAKRFAPSISWLD